MKTLLILLFTASMAMGAEIRQMVIERIPQKDAYSFKDHSGKTVNVPAIPSYLQAKVWYFDDQEGQMHTVDLTGQSEIDKILEIESQGVLGLGKSFTRAVFGFARENGTLTIDSADFVLTKSFTLLSFKRQASFKDELGNTIAEKPLGDAATQKAVNDLVTIVGGK